jgi:hypothetical protein
MKFKVDNPEHSKQIQECLFWLGYNWEMCKYPEEPQYTVSKYLYAETDGLLLHGSKEGCFDSATSKETTLEELKAMFVEQEPIDNSIPKHNIENTMTQFLHQLQKRLASVNIAVYIYSDEIQVSDMDSDAIARVTTYEQLLEAIKVKEQFMNMFKEV